jgi:2-iminobutanoate/2-iminopropanoate deaminase
MAKNVISTEGAPKAIGPYSQAIATSGGRLLFCSGQIPLDPASGQMVGTGDVRAQAKQVMENLGAVLRAGGASFSTVVKTTIFLQDLADFGAVNEVYGSYFADAGAPPARATVQVAGLPRGALVEIEAIAEIP